MNEDVLPTVVIAGLCIVATGYTAAALPPSLSTGPREAITEGGVPVVSDVVVHVRPLAERLADELRGDVSPPEGATPPPSATPPENVDVSGTPPAGVTAGARADRSETASSDAGDGGGPELTLLLPLVGVIAGVGWYLRRGDGGGERTAPNGESTGETERARASPSSVERTADAPADTNGVYRAWADLLDAAEIPRSSALTPAESAARAVDRGFDADAVDRLRIAFEEVRYGDGAATDRRVRRAESALRDAGVRR